MKIACLGWGSLVWDAREIGVLEKDWHEDGPMLPIEFTRYSSDNRVTLIVDRLAEPVRVLWAELEVKNLEEATRLLAKREGTNEKNIRSIGIDVNGDDAIEVEVARWLGSKQLPVAIWTGLSYKNGERPSIIDILKHLKGLRGQERVRAEEYIRKAPRQINTRYRMKIEAELDWKPSLV